MDIQKNPRREKLETQGKNSKLREKTKLKEKNKTQGKNSTFGEQILRLWHQVMLKKPDLPPSIAMFAGCLPKIGQKRPWFKVRTLPDFELQAATIFSISFSLKSSRRRRDRRRPGASLKVTSISLIISTVGISGIFNLTKKTWNIYTNNPKTHQPVVVLPLVFK